MSSEEMLHDQADATLPSEQEPAKKVVRRVTRKKSPVVASPAEIPVAENTQEEIPPEPKKRGRPKGSSVAKSAPRPRVAPKMKPAS
jgi:transcription termination factor Rho